VGAEGAAAEDTDGVGAGVRRRGAEGGRGQGRGGVGRDGVGRGGLGARAQRRWAGAWRRGTEGATVEGRGTTASGAAAWRGQQRHGVRVRMTKDEVPKLFTRSLPSACDLALGKYFFKILKYSLPSARSLALGKVVIAECPLGNTRQRFFYYSLPSVNQLTLGKAYFAECHFWTLNKVHFYFFYFPNQIFVVCSYTI
jgi:hypothetical protein